MKAQNYLSVVMSADARKALGLRLCDCILPFVARPTATDLATAQAIVARVKAADFDASVATWSRHGGYAVVGE